MTQSLKDSYPKIVWAMDCYFHANNFDLDGFKDQLANRVWQDANPTFKDDFKTVIAKRLISMKEHVDLTEIDFETDDELYDHLQKIFDYIYNDGKHPNSMSP